MKHNYFEEERYERAKKRVKDIQGFYWHLFWYVAVNLFLTFGGTIRNILNGDSFENIYFTFIIFFRASRAAFSIASAVLDAFPTPTPTDPVRFPKTSATLKLNLRPPATTRVTRRTSITF